MRRAQGRVPRHRRGMTLMLVLLLLALLSLVLARKSQTARIASVGSSAAGFRVQARWAADGVIEQYLSKSADMSVSWESLLQHADWRLGLLQVQIKPSTSESKVAVAHTKLERWRPLWREKTALSLVENPDDALKDSGYTALECLLDLKDATGAGAYLAPRDGCAPADFLTVWGDGKIDLNRAPREVLATAMIGLTDAQINGIIEARKQSPIDSLLLLAQQLSLGESQLKMMEQVAVFVPRTLEMIITIRHGQMQAIYFAVLDTKDPVRILELRLIQ